MNDDARLERIFSDALADSAPSRAPDRVRTDIKKTLSQTRPRPRWLALIKEPPMRISSRVAVGSPTTRLAAIAIATLLLAVLATGAVVAGASLLAGPGVIVVAQDGSGTYTTITEAVAAAEDGDTVLVKPGIYREAVVVDKDITLRGDGDRDEIVIEISPDGPTSLAGGYGSAPFGVHLLDTTATLANLSVIGPDVASALVVTGGAPVIEDLRLELAGSFTGSPRNAFVYTDGATGSMRDVTTDGFGYVRKGSSPTIELLDHTKEGFIIMDLDSDPFITASTMSPDVLNGAEPTITESVLVGVTIEATDTPVFRDNVFANPDYEIGDQDVLDNSATTVAIDVTGSSPLLKDNRIGDHPIGVRVNGGDPTIEGNTIEHNAVGMSVMSDSGMTFTGNTFCGNSLDLEVPEGSAITLEGNEVCSETAASSG